MAGWLPWCVPLIFGWRSARLGQDSNWDLFNYHLYNPFALLHGKDAIDLAPAGMQTWFNPTLDLPYFIAAQLLPAPLLAFGMGVLHGLVFPLLVVIARDLPDWRGRDPRVGSLVVAAACMLGANFSSQLGNTMGDATTAPLVLGAIAVIARGISSGADIDRRAALLAGLLAGLAAGLKLTNALYVLALLAAMAVPGAGVASRMRAVALCAAGAILGVAITGGWWHVRLALELGNPLFPQFSAWFPNDLAQPTLIADVRFLPRTFTDQLLWPFVFSIHPLRVNELPIRQLIWPAWALATVAWLLVRPARGRTGVAFLIVFVGVAYGAWQEIFSIYRYLLAAELLVPVLLFAVLCAFLPLRIAWLAWLVLVTMSFGYYWTGTARTWDRQPLAPAAYSVQVPPLDAPRTLVLLVTESPPRAWMATRFPDTVAFAWLGSNLREGPGYRKRLDAMLAARPEAFAIVGAANAGRLDGVAFERSQRASAATILAHYGLALDAGGCKTFAAAMGTLDFPYQWCPVARRND